MIITFSQIVIFFLIFARLVGLVMFAPVFNRKEVMSSVKIAFCFWIATLLLFVVPLPISFATTPLTFMIAIGIELCIGMIIGFIADLMIIAIEFGGSLMDTQAGLSVANILDPSSGRQITLLSQLLKWTAFIIFIYIDGHHLLLSAVVKSFELLPPGGSVHITSTSQYLVQIGKDIFDIGVRLAIPVILIVFMVDYAFGILNRVAEQINVFQLGFQVKPVVSLIVIFITTPILVESVTEISQKVITNVMVTIQQLAGL